MHLNVGHTHEDIDACLSLVTSALASARTLETPIDVATCIENKLGPLYARHRMEFEVEMVDCVTWDIVQQCLGLWGCPFVQRIVGLLCCSFKPQALKPQPTSIWSEVRNFTNLIPDRVSFKNCYLDRPDKKNPNNLKVPQAFTFLPRSHMPRDIAKEERVPVAMRAGEDQADLDIFALIKMNMSDKVLCQSPILVYPGTLIADVETFLNKLNTTSDVTYPKLEEERAQEIRELADSFEEDYPHMTRAVAFYRRMLNPTNLKGYTELNFLKGTRSSTRWCQINLGDRPLPPRPHELQVVFHRRRGWWARCWDDQLGVIRRGLRRKKIASIISIYEWLHSTNCHMFKHHIHSNPTIQMCIE